MGQFVAEINTVVVERRKLPFFARIWHGLLLGFLLGTVNMVFQSSEFRGNVLEPEFAAMYIGFTAVWWFMGAAIDFFRTRDPKPPSTGRTALYWILVAGSAAVIVARALYLFPGGAGLFHPTHSADLSQAVGICMGRMSADKVDSEDVKMRYCECLSEVMTTSLEHGDTRPPPEMSKAADATCRGK